MLTVDEQYMKRCIQLARNGQIGAPPNPMVGAVIVCDGRIIGEGFHARCGQGHAEVNAFASVAKKDECLLADSTIYVSLEPCAHYGKTPPCAKLIVEKGVKRVVVGCVDPFAKVQGRGIQMIRDAGIEVEVGVLEQECKKLIARFITFHTAKRPYVTLKWAQSSDNVMGIVKRVSNDEVVGVPFKISTPVTMRRVHHLRAINNAIFVGYNTALLDNPSLTTRYYGGPNPVRVVFDPHGQLPAHLQIFNDEAQTIVFGLERNLAVESLSNVECVEISPEAEAIPQILDELYRRNIQSLLVEGGRKTLLEFITLNLWDEIHAEHAVAQASSLMGEQDMAVYAPVVTLTPKEIEQLDSSQVYHYYQI